jgi:hypothetical protein
MSQLNIKILLDRWTNDPEFRKAMRQNAEVAIKKEKMDLTPQEWQALKRVDWTLSDDELNARISKGM